MKHKFQTIECFTIASNKSNLTPLKDYPQPEDSEQSNQ